MIRLTDCWGLRPSPLLQERAYKPLNEAEAEADTSARPEAELWRPIRKKSRLRRFLERHDLKLGELIGVAVIGFVGGVFFWLLTLLLEATQ